LRGTQKSPPDPSCSATDQAELERLRAWLDSLAEGIPRIFQSTSWRLGFGLVRLAKGLVRREHLPAASYRVSQVLDEYRIWRDGQGLEPRGSGLVPAPALAPAQVTILAGDLASSQARNTLPLAERWSQTARVQVIGFRFDPAPSPGGALDRVRLDTFQGSSFPAFHRRLAQALVACTGRHLVATAPNLCSLGLALLANQLSGAPVWLASAPPEQPAAASSQTGAMGLLDPRDPEWNRLLADADRNLPRLSAEATPPAASAPAVLPQARAFAELFAGFHATGRYEPCAG
jgi:hypothetical protein